MTSSLYIPRHNRLQYVPPIVVAGVMAYLSSRYLFVGSGLSLIPWAILAMTWGLISRDRTQARNLGAIYGFSLSFIFLLIDTSGNSSPERLLFLLVVTTSLAIFGGLCGAMLSVAAHRLSRKKPRKR